MQRCRIESLGVSLQPGPLFRRGSIDHAVRAGRACLKGSRYNPEDVRVLVNAGIHRDGHVCEPAIAAYIQRRLGINVEFQGRRTLAFDLQNGGCGMLNAAHVLSALLLSGEAQVGMVVASEANSDRRPDPAYTYPPSGAATLIDLSPREGVGFGAFAFHTHDEYSELYSSVVSLKVARGQLQLRRRGEELEEVYLSKARAVVDEVLEKDGLRREDVALVVPAQISQRFLEKLPEAIGFPKERVASYTDRLADTLSTSTFLALHEAMKGPECAPGKTVVLLAFGSGVTIGAASYTR
ncbi:MAG: 3-oxoacyl-ACP synthase III family protein [Myxococcales bacterium]|jgi:3-oxoacyl-[acyl-carrier-protein] synthase-3